jgi:hypothetical protein
VWPSHDLLFAVVEGDILGTIGVFLSGAGSILTALGAIHYERKRGEKICEQRFQAYLDGIKMRDTLGEP